MTHHDNRIKRLLGTLTFSLLACLPALSQIDGAPGPKYRLPYKNTYVKELFVTENAFINAKPEIIPHGSYEEARKILPSPIWEGHEKEIEMYWKAWEIGIQNITDPQEGSGFVCTYIDTAYNGNIFMWDTSFILMFAKYGERFFPFHRTLDNFYSHQHQDGFICREIRADGSDALHRYDPTSTGPNLIPWAEMCYFRQYGDMDRLHKVFPVLCGYYNWLHLNRTWPNGTYWSSGWGTGMDNMPRVQDGYNPIFSHGHMVWLDTNLQQIFIAHELLQMGFYIERWQEIENYETEAEELTKYVRENLWDEKSGFLYDQYRDGSLCETMGVSAYWALLTDVLSQGQTDRLVSHLTDTTTFARTHCVPSLAANHPKYRANGRYWQGGVWPGTNYMVLYGLAEKGYYKLAHQVAMNHYNNVLEVYKKTGTFWEYYAPESAEPGFMARDNFVGWGGVAPIAVLLEYIMGIRADYSKSQISWDLNLLESHGVDRYPYGPNGEISLRAGKRSRLNDRPSISIKTNVPFTLVLRYGDKEEKVEVTASGTY